MCCPPIAQMLLASASWKLLSLRREQLRLAEKKQKALGKQQEMQEERMHWLSPGRDSRVFWKRGLKPATQFTKFTNQ